MLRFIVFIFLIYTSLFSHIKITNYEKYFENNKNIMFFIDPKNGKIVKANKSASEFYGYSITELEKMNIKDFNTFTKEQVQDEMAKAQEEKRNYFLFSHRLADGSIVKVRVFSSPIISSGKSLLYSTIYPLVLEKEFLDHFNQTLEEQVHLQIDEIRKNEKKITQMYLIGFILSMLVLFIVIVNLYRRNKLSQQIHNQQIKYQTIMQNSSDAIFIVDLNGYILEYSKQFREMLGYSDEQLRRLHVSDYEAIHSKEKIKYTIKNTMYTPVSFQSKYKKADGSLIDVSLNIVRIKLDKDEFIYTSCRDITKQNQLQLELLEQKLEYESIFDYAQDGIALIDLEYNFLNCNKAFLDLTGYSKDELLKMNCQDITAEESKKINEEALNEAIEKGHVENIEKNCIVASGNRKTVSMSASLLPDEKRLLLLLHDTTVLKLMEHQSRLASMGEMIGNIAHQWRQPLSVISTAASGISFRLDYEGKIDNGELKRTTSSIVSQTKYLSKTIDDFKNFVKGDKTEKYLSIKETITDVINLTKATIDNNYIELVTDIEDDINIFGNKNELVQAFINIINNAKDSLKENVKDDDEKFLFISTKRIDDNSLVLKVLDSGGGIPSKIIGRIFEPYFTTKHQSLGTGIGLSMVEKIIRQRHNAKIDVFNEEFKYKEKDYIGASFNILFEDNRLK